MYQRNFLLVAAFCATAATLSAGGFFLSIRGPAGDVKDAVLTLEAQGCHDYSKATIAGQAEGIVNGSRQSIQLALTTTAKPGVYVVRKQWPSEGKWVLVFTGTFADRNTHTIVELGTDGRLLPDSAPSKGIRMVMRPLAAGEIEAVLREPARRS